MSVQGFSPNKKLPDMQASADAMPTWRATLFTAFSILMVVAATASFGEAAVAPAHRVAALVMFGVTSIYFGGMVVTRLIERVRAS